MTAYEIDNSILEKFGGKRSPNVVYTKLSSMERENLICCAQSKHGRVYSITENGKETAEDMPRIIQETQSLTSILLKS
jgi:DNA-binding PadR family transcriptional regulator